MSQGDSIFGADPDRLRELVRSGLAADDMDDQEDVLATRSAGSLIERPGTRIGRYRLLRVLGEGGMGMVHLAEQEGAIRRRVAVKVIKPGMDSKRVIARFETERQALALLDHPNIAQVYDAGTTESGRPYFAMEYVKGRPITEYCDCHRLSIEDRLGLFQQVCLAVHHAHQKGIIHRDLKPSNILVVAEGDKAIPKIIDFGVAKAIAQPLTGRTLYTEAGQFIGTPEYTSPEQAEMAAQDIDTRSDIYSLGAVLYELLTGTLPFDSATLRSGGIEHIRHVIREEEPKTPSTRLTSLGEQATKVAQHRRTEVGTLARRLHRELEWIPLKAMRKERARRYRSASELADDIENYLQGEPLIAGPPGTLYRFRKSVRRNVVLSAAVLAVAVTLLLGLAGTTAMYFRAERLRVEAQEAAAREASARKEAERAGQRAEQAATEARQAAEKEAIARGEAEQALAQAQAVSDFLVEDILGAESFSQVEELDFDHILDITSEKLEGRFWDQPLVEARILDALGNRYSSVGKYEFGRQHLERAYQIRVQHLGPEHWDTNKTANMLAWAYWHEGRHDDAHKLWNARSEILQKAHGEGHQLRLLFMYNIGQTYTELGRYKEAEVQLDKVLELCEDSRGGYRNFVLRMASLRRGQNYAAWGRNEEAEQALLEALATIRQQRGPEDTRALECTKALSRV